VSAPRAGRGAASLLRLLLDLCLLRRGPQDLPYSIALTRGLVLLGVGVDLLLARWVEAGDAGFARIALSLVLLLALPWFVLGLRGHRARYAQTLAAFAGTGVIFTLAFLPVAIRAAGLPAPDLDVEPTREQLAIGWITLVLVGWKLAINGNIWRHALDWPRAGGVLLAVGLFVFEIGLMRMLFVPAAP
jgi:hypothetical protein